MPMYEGAGNGPLWWIGYLLVAITLVTAMILVMLAGIGRAGKATAPRADAAATPEQPRRIAGGTTPATPDRGDPHHPLSGAA